MDNLTNFHVHLITYLGCSFGSDKLVECKSNRLPYKSVVKHTMAREAQHGLELECSRQWWKWLTENCESILLHYFLLISPSPAFTGSLFASLVPSAYQCACSFHSHIYFLNYFVTGNCFSLSVLQLSLSVLTSYSLSVLLLLQDNCLTLYFCRYLILQKSELCQRCNTSVKD